MFASGAFNSSSNGSQHASLSGQAPGCPDSIYSAYFGVKPRQHSKVGSCMALQSVTGHKAEACPSQYRLLLRQRH